MTYIKWKDEVESYLASMPREEKQKIFSYFSEMYADKRDAGKSEEQIIEEFGAPYDVAKKILADSREFSTPPLDADSLNGGKELPERNAPPTAATQPPKKKKSVFKVLLCVFLTIVMVGLTVSLIGGALSVTLEGFVSIGFTAGALAIAQCGGAEGAAMIGLGLIISGVGITLLAPFGTLCRFLWRKLGAYMKGV